MRGLVRRVAKETRTRWLGGLHGRHRRIRAPGGIVSISFDDVPTSAYRNARPLLDDFEVRATWYVSLGIDRDASGRASADYVGEAEVVRLHEERHHVACHTFSHYRLPDGTWSGLAEDAFRNSERLSELVGGRPIRHFSYPYGHVSLRAKSALGRRYLTLRSSQPGVNAGRADMRMLRGVCLYAPSFDEAALRATVMQAARRDGWAIFYTHGVTERPGSYDCTPRQLETLLGACRDLGVALMDVESAYESIVRDA